jgi:hypothetical protein
MVVKRHDELYFDVSGVDKDNFILQWVRGEKIGTGDEISVSVKEISGITEPVKRFPFEKMDEESVILTEEDVRLMYREKLACFHALEKLLSDEGLI